MSQRNVAASIRARLKQHADARQQDFNLTLTHYGLERLLYRLSISQHANSYLLKGALLFALWYDQPHRPTRDADLLGFGPDDIESAVSAFREICQIPVDDGVAFDLASVKGAAIRKEAGYGGVRVDLLATLDGARIALQVDIGFWRRGDPGARGGALPGAAARPARTPVARLPQVHGGGREVSRGVPAGHGQHAHEGLL